MRRLKEKSEAWMEGTRGKRDGRDAREGVRRKGRPGMNHWGEGPIGEEEYRRYRNLSKRVQEGRVFFTSFSCSMRRESGVNLAMQNTAPRSLRRTVAFVLI